MLSELIVLIRALFLPYRTPLASARSKFPRFQSWQA
jgi:hypothetical protein